MNTKNTLLLGSLCLCLASMNANAIVPVKLVPLPAAINVVSEGTTASPGGNNVNATCPQTYTFTFGLSAVTGGNFTYQFTRSDGSSGPTQSATANSPGQSISVSTTWQLGGPGYSVSGAWVGIKINGGPATHLSSFSLQCATPKVCPPPCNKIDPACAALWTNAPAGCSGGSTSGGAPASNTN